MAIKEANILPQLDTSHVHTFEPTTELTVLVLVEDIYLYLNSYTRVALDALFVGYPLCKSSVSI